MTKESTNRPDIEAAMRHVAHIAEIAPFRKSGLGQDLIAARYVVDTLNGYGLEAGLQTFVTYDSDPGEATLEVDGVTPMRFAVRACAHVEATPEQGYEGELVHVGPGGESDYAGKNVRGKVVLAEVSYAPATPEKARIAAAKGAAGIVLMNWGQGDEPGIPWRALKAVWGNPTPESWTQIPRIFGLSVSRKDGEALRDLSNGGARIRVTVSASRVWREVSQPIAWLRAPKTSPEADQFLVVSGHIDSWMPGVTDNISGDAVMMEVARWLAKRRDTLRRSVAFCFWNGHEVAEAAGSTYFVDSHWEEINRNAVAYLNIDSVGMRGTTRFTISSCPELAAFTMDCARSALPRTTPIAQSSLARVGDQSFFGVGVSAATGRHGYSFEEIARRNGATLGWYNHTEFDTIDVLDENILRDDLAYWAEVIERLAKDKALPHRFTPRLDDLASRFSQILKSDVDPADLHRIPKAIEALRPAVAWLDARLDEADASETDLINRAVLRLSRLLTFISGSASGKYDQDSYGLSSLASPVPLLALAERYAVLAPDSLEARLIVTRLMRQRHQITDALQACADLLDDVRRLHAAAQIRKREDAI